MPAVTFGLVALAILVPFIAATALLQCADDDRPKGEAKLVNIAEPPLKFSMPDTNQQIDRALAA